MRNFRNVLGLMFILVSFETVAQQVPKTVVAEHFTNTWCSVCFSRNPGLYSNLGAFPSVLHIAYYPSAPYASCPLSMHNPGENDARTNFYGIYGATPQLVVNGSVISGSFTTPAIYSTPLAQTSSFKLSTQISASGSDSIAVKIVVKKVDTSSLSSLQLFGAVVEDTLFFAAQNGETVQYDVFRKALFGNLPLSIVAPAVVGDSTIYRKVIFLNSAWAKNRLYALAILQQTNKEVVQASRSAHIPASTGTLNLKTVEALKIFPNPTSQWLSIETNDNAAGDFLIVDGKGALVLSGRIDNNSRRIDIRTLSVGTYFLLSSIDGFTSPSKFVKN